MLKIKHDALAVNPESAVNSVNFFHLLISLHNKIMYNIFYMESYRSGHNEAHSKCVCRFFGTRVRIPPTPPENDALKRISV